MYRLLSFIGSLFLSISAFAGQGFYYTIVNNTNETITTEVKNPICIKQNASDLDKIVITPKSSSTRRYVEENCGLTNPSFTLFFHGNGKLAQLRYANDMPQEEQDLCLFTAEIAPAFCYSFEPDDIQIDWSKPDKQYHLTLTVKALQAVQ